MLRDGYYESEVLNAIIQNLEPNGILWDVGGNIGLHAITAKAMRPGAEVLCFEPSPAIVGTLLCNNRLNGGGVSIVTAALSDRTGVQTLHVAGDGNTGISTLSPWPQVSYASVVMVQAVEGDKLIGMGLPAPTVLKIDVEGHEKYVLRGMRQILSRASAVVFEDVPGASEAKSLLMDAGFLVTKLDRQESTAHDLENFVALRPTPET